MKVPRSLQNWLSIAGITLVNISIVIIFVLFLTSLFIKESSSYLGLFMYIVFPTFLVIGLILIPIGMWRKLKRDKKKKGDETQDWLPSIDIKDKKHRNALIVFLSTAIFFIVISSVGSYEAYHYSESIKFCGTLCHRVMEPEYTAYQNSSHARVACVECHVGEGASWYIKSKLSGLYQVYSVIFKKYSRPIGTPITSLRPARETCEKCHWPQKFYSRKLVVYKNFLADSLNSEWDIALQMKIGPSNSAQGFQEGIHWHINQDVKIEYIANTKNRESIPWVRFTNLKTGKILIFEDQENKLTKKAMDTLPIRVMDCMDCHNRPSHIYRSPQRFVDEGLVNGSIPKELPNIKMISMKILKDIFPDRDTAYRIINDSIMAYYKNNYPVLYSKQRNLVNQAIAGIKDGFNKNMFPYMKVRWDAYPDHIGHLESDGCFRCHSGKHTTNNNRSISKDCDLCHNILVQGNLNQLESVSVLDKLKFKHPKDIGNDWQKYFCSECHRYLY